MDRRAAGGRLGRSRLGAACRLHWRLLRVHGELRDGALHLPARVFWRALRPKLSRRRAHSFLRALFVSSGAGLFGIHLWRLSHSLLLFSLCAQGQSAESADFGHLYGHSGGRAALYQLEHVCRLWTVHGDQVFLPKAQRGPIYLALFYCLVLPAGNLHPHAASAHLDGICHGRQVAQANGTVVSSALEMGFFPCPRLLVCLCDHYSGALDHQHERLCRFACV